MKNKIQFGLWGMILFTCLLFSCGSEDETPKPEPIVGTWNYSSYEYEATINGQDYIQYLSETLGVSQAEAQFIANLYFLQKFEQQLEDLRVSFDSDGTYVLQQGTTEETGTYSLNADNTELTLVSETETTVFDVIDLTTNTMELGLTELLQEDFDKDGVEEEIEVDLLLSLVK